MMAAGGVLATCGVGVGGSNFQNSDRHDKHNHACVNSLAVLGAAIAAARLPPANYKTAAGRWALPFTLTARRRSRR